MDAPPPAIKHTVLLQPTRNCAGDLARNPPQAERRSYAAPRLKQNYECKPRQPNGQRQRRWHQRLVGQRPQSRKPMVGGNTAHSQASDDEARRHRTTSDTAATAPQPRADVQTGRRFAGHILALRIRHRANPPLATRRRAANANHTSRTGEMRPMPLASRARR